ncbi:F-box domain-containing protein [Mycena chlorophos]|uniref:F-box domain-containing protein n=1 Tax=Mycena chlorophos TaxID=658473 RepID=A0A8H6TN50_MYCCL|nr:F-box domain-containing protein [Mycena chlorophos]
MARYDENPHSNAVLRSRLSCINLTVIELESKLEALRGEQSEIAALLDDIVYPVLSVPPEIKLRIFAFASASPVLGNAEDYRELDSGPLLLAGVCRDWRQLVCGAPELWSTLRIVQERKRSNTRQLVEAVELWLLRSAARPLQLSFSSQHVNRSRLAPALASCAPRICSLDWEVDFDATIDEALKGRLGKLQYLGISAGSRWTAFESAPQLTHAKVLLWTRNPQLPWSQIKYLQLSFATRDPDAILRFLLTTTAVETLAADDNHVSLLLPTLATEASSPGVLPNLKHLIVRYSVRDFQYLWNPKSSLDFLLLKEFLDVRLEPQGHEAAKIRSLEIVLLSHEECTEEIHLAKEMLAKGGFAEKGLKIRVASGR